MNARLQRRVGKAATLAGSPDLRAFKRWRDARFADLCWASRPDPRMAMNWRLHS